jgi:hypothetical protein
MELGPKNSESQPEPDPLPTPGPRATYYWYGYRKPPEQYQNTSITEQQIGNVAIKAVSDS